MSENETSLAQIEANRKNAQKSTGPKTAEGKCTVRLNAVKHGLLSKSVVLNGKEDPEEFNALVEQLYEQLQPQGMLEEILVRQIAVCYWKLLRVYKYETSEINLQLEHIRTENQDPREAMVDVDKANPYLKQIERKTLKSTLTGIQDLMAPLTEARSEVETLGYLTEETIQTIESIWGDEDPNFIIQLEILTEAVEKSQNHQIQKEENQSDPAESRTTPEECKRTTLKLLDNKLQELDAQKKIIQEN